MTKAPKIAKAQGRSVKEWIGKTPDSRPPPHVLTRIWDRCEGKCHITGRKIMVGEAYDYDHIKRLEDGGENRESNLAPALKEPHKAKTKAERKRQAKADAAKKAHLGIKPAPKKEIQSPGFPVVEKTSKIAKGGKIDKSALAPLPRRCIFTGKVIE